MIDIHTHILHCQDDGPPSLEDAIEMAWVAVNDGTTIIAATPHAPDSEGNYSVPRVQSRHAELQEALSQHDIPLEIVLGTEIHYDPNLVEQFREGNVLTYNNGSTILLECPLYQPFPARFEETVEALQEAGYRILLAHPERIRDVMFDPNILIPLIERGVLMQLTAETLTGGQGRDMRMLAETMISHHLVHILASDGHGASYRRPILSKGHERVAALIGEEAARRLVEEYPRAVIDDQPITPPPPKRVEGFEV